MGDCNCRGGAHAAGTICVECDIPQLARNNYFTGKLLVERDFTDEQRYFMGKERRHNQRLHGWGAVCGLKVSPHPNPACADRFVLIDPGTAIDCCGREILVPRQECFDFAACYLEKWQAQIGPDSEPDTKPVDVQICISYLECATEDVPALFDDCSSNSSSRPNRILENYRFDVLVKPPNTTPHVAGVKLQWDDTLNFADAVRAVRHKDRIYLLTSNATAAALYALDAATHSVLMPPVTFPAVAGLDLAVSPDANSIYLALQAAAPGSAPEISARKSADLTESSRASVGAASDSTLRLATTPDGRILSIGSATGLLVWDGAVAASTAVAGIANPIGIAATEKFAYAITNGVNSISAIDLATLAVTTIPAGTAPTSIAAAATTGGDAIAVMDATTLYLITLPSGPASPQPIGKIAGFANPPIGLAMSRDGRWVFALEQDASGKDYVQAADAHAAAMGSANILGAAVAVGSGPVVETIGSDGSELFVSYLGNSTVPGGVAIVDIKQADCTDRFKCAIEPCPDCTDGNCIVLATIDGFIWEKPITASQIDNYSDRRILASTSLLTDVVRCLLDQGGGGGAQGPQGPPGLPGQNGTNGTNGKDGAPGLAGPGIDQVTVTFVPCDQPGGATITGVSPARMLELTIPGDCNKDLTTITAVSWKQNGATISFSALMDPGLTVEFSGNVHAADLTANSVFLLAPVANNSLTTWAEVRITIEAGNIGAGGFSTSTAPQVNGVRLRLDAVTMRQLEELKAAKLRVIVKGDFIRDATANERGIDADHLPPWLPQHNTGDGIAGGTFESWIAVKQG